MKYTDEIYEVRWKCHKNKRFCCHYPQLNSMFTSRYRLTRKGKCSKLQPSSISNLQKSLMSTIINLAQNFVGRNNLNLLQPIGQFGTRIHGGKDAASPRYIFTQLRYVWQSKWNMKTKMRMVGWIMSNKVICFSILPYLCCFGNIVLKSLHKTTCQND